MNILRLKIRKKKNIAKIKKTKGKKRKNNLN